MRQGAARAGILVLLAVSASACTYVEHVQIVHVAAHPSPVAAPREEPRMPFQDPLDAVVRVASVHGECSATAVGDRIAITASACIDRLTKPSSMSFDKLRARVGGGAVAWKVVPVIAILEAPCHGVAAIVTDEPIADGVAMRMRLGSTAVVGEPLRVVGFGRCSGLSTGHRVVGFAGSVRELGDTAFSLDAAACSGDAGGPIVSDWTGEVVGVLSGTPVQADDKSSTSISGVAARVDVARGLLAQAFLMAHGVSAAELPPIACP